MEIYSSSPRIKICGITRPQDAILAAKLGANAIGLVFYAKSPRNVSIEQAQAIIEALPPFVTTVGLFVNPELEFINTILNKIPIDRLQFHGEELPDFCQSFRKPYLKALRMKPKANVHEFFENYTKASAILLDAYVQGVKGGTGTTFDWQQIPNNLSKPIILAGGLTVNNVAQAISKVKPYAVDVSGGIEKEKGIKDEEKMALFIKEVTKF